MNREVHWTTIIRLVYAAAFLVLAVRLWMVASATETGWETILVDWRQGALGWIGLAPKPMEERSPIEQAQFFKQEAARILRQHPRDAELAIGAAWMLDSYSRSYEKHVSRIEKYRWGSLRTYDFNTIRELGAQFVTAASEECLLLVERAIELDPENLHWRRMYALLQFHYAPYHKLRGARRTSWKAAILGYSRRDPQNALYDYLIIAHLWELSTKSETINVQTPGEPGLRIRITDETLFAELMSRLDRVQEKEFLAVGEAGIPATSKFLNHTRLTKTEQAKLASERLLSQRYRALVLAISSVHYGLAANAWYEKDDQKRLRTLRQHQRLFEQASTLDEPVVWKMQHRFEYMRSIAYDEFVKLAQKIPGSVSERELHGLESREREQRRRTFLHQVAGLNQYWDQIDNAIHRLPPVAASWTASFATAFLLKLAVVLLLVGGILSRRGRPTSKEDGWAYLPEWALGVLVAVTVAEMAPAEVISRQHQKWSVFLFLGLIALAAASVLVRLIYRSLKRHRFRFSLLLVMTIMAGLGLVLTVWNLLEWPIDSLRSNPPKLWLEGRKPPFVDQPAFMEDLAWTVSYLQQTWVEVMYCFFWNDGPAISISVPLIIIGGWWIWQLPKRNGERFLSYWRSKFPARFGVFATLMGRFALTGAMCWLLVYLAFTPTSIQAVEEDYQAKMLVVRDPAKNLAVQKSLADNVRLTPAQEIRLKERLNLGPGGKSTP